MIDKTETIQLKEEYSNNWVAEDGLSLLDYRGDRPPFPGFTRKTAANDNGILGKCYFIWLLKHHDLLTNEDKYEFYNSIFDLQRIKNGKPIKGLYNRNPGRDDNPEALDNYAAICSGSVLIDSDFKLDIVFYGLENGFNFNNVSLNKYNIKRWKQGSDVAFYKMCVNYAPTIWEYIWLVGGIIFNSFQHKNIKQGKMTSEALLTWIRLKAIELTEEKNKMKKQYKWMYSIVRTFRYFWVWMLKKSTDGKGIETVITVYFGGRNPENPMIKLAQGVIY